MPPRRKRIHAWLPRDLSLRLRAYRAARDVTVSAVVEAALREYLDGAGDLTLVKVRLDRLARSMGRLHRDLGLLLETFGAWVRVWYAHTPTLADADRGIAWRQAGARVQELVKHVASRLRTDKSFAEAFAAAILGDDDAKGAAPTPRDEP